MTASRLDISRKVTVHAEITVDAVSEISIVSLIMEYQRTSHVAAAACSGEGTRAAKNQRRKCVNWRAR